MSGGRKDDGNEQGVRDGEKKENERREQERKGKERTVHSENGRDERGTDESTRTAAAFDRACVSRVPVPLPVWTGRHFGVNRRVLLGEDHPAFLFFPPLPFLGASSAT